MDMEYNTTHALTPSHLETALRLLSESALVLVTDRLLPAGLALLDYTFGQSGGNSTSRSARELLNAGE